MPEQQLELQTLQSAVAATGNGSNLDVGGTGTTAAVFVVSGTFSATVTFEGSPDEGTTWVSLVGLKVGTTTFATTTTATGTFVVPCAGLTHVRGRVTWTSGTSVTVRARAIPQDVALSYFGVAESGGAAPAGEAHIGEVGGRLARVSSEFTRPSNTTAYAAKDVVSADPSTIRTFDAAARISGGSGYIVKAILQSSVAAETQAMRLHLYNTSSPTVLDDNAANTVLYADRAKYVGYIDFPALATETGASVAQAVWTGPALAFTTSGNDDLFGVLETLTAYTPTSAATYAIALVVDQN